METEVRVTRTYQQLLLIFLLHSYRGQCHGFALESSVARRGNVPRGPVDRYVATYIPGIYWYILRPVVEL